MSNCSLFTGEALPGPDNLDVWLGAGTDLFDLYDMTQDIFNYYRTRYAVEFNLFYYSEHIEIGLTRPLPGQNDQPVLLFTRRIKFYRTEEEFRTRS